MIKILGYTGILFLALFGFNSNESNDSYEALWSQVIVFEQQRKPKSALDIVEKIYQKAVKEDNRIQRTKAVTFKGKFILQTEENAYQALVKLFKEEIELSPSPTKQILLSVEATLYLQYYQQNLYKINQRKRIEGFEENNPETWPSNTFEEKISTNFLRSIQNPEALKIELEKYDELLDVYDEETLEFMPSLFDLLSNRALNYFTDGNSYLGEASFAFRLNKEEYFASQEEFVNLNIVSEDSSSLKYQALLLMQRLIRYHEGNPSAQAFINLKRLDFLKNHAILTNKDELYLNRLKELDDSYDGTLLHAEVLSKLAREHQLMASNSSKRTNDYNISLTYCQEAISRYPKEFATSQAINIYNEILSKRIFVTTEDVYPSEKNFLIKLDYKNIDKAHIELVKLVHDEINFPLNYRERDDFIKSLKRKKSLKKWMLDLPNDGLRYQQSVEVSLDGLAKGEYAFIVSMDENKLSKKSNTEIVLLRISDMAYQFRSSNQGHALFVMDRNTGEKLENVEVKLYKEVYNRKSRNNERKLLKQFKTDKDGKIEIKDAYHQSARVELKLNDDILRLNSQYYFSVQTKPRSIKEVSIFTDRAIYRPGQTIYFKAVLYEKNTDRVPALMANQKCKISFYDANRQVVESKTIRTNDFGSAEGSFIAPQAGLRGRMTIQIDNYSGIANLRVEEYKRPKFELKIDSLKKAYKLGDSVAVNISVKTFSGANVDGAKVVYRVTREVSFPWWFWGCGYRYPNLSRTAMEIVNGSSKTNAEGQSSFVFKAIGDRQVKKKWNPLYSYVIYADVTDLNGETQSIAQTIRIGSKSKNIKLNIPKLVFRNGNNNLELTIEDFNKFPKNGKGRLFFERLKEPELVSNNRYWGETDSILLDKASFKKRHPFDHYQDFDIRQWETQEVYSGFQIDQTGLKKYDLPKLDVGVYKCIAIIEDELGGEIRAEEIFTLIDLKKKVFTKTQHLFYQLDKTEYEPGDQLRLDLGTGSGQLKMMYRLEKNGVLKEEKWLTLNPHKRLKFPILDTDRGGFKIHLTYVKNNRTSNEVINVVVPWNDKKLSVVFESFRNKILPGAKEKYKVKVLNKDQKTDSIELLACMFDASLDQFVKHKWKRSFYPSYRQTVNNRFFGFGQQGALYRITNYYENDKNWKGKYYQYPSLHDFGLRPNVIMMRNMGGREMMDGIGVERAMEMDEVVVSAKRMPPPGRQAKMSSAVIDGVSMDSDDLESSQSFEESKLEPDDSTPIMQVRKNLNETVFFYPDLKSNDKGEIEFEFVMNEALTKWKLLSFAHSKDFKYGFDVQELVTQKDLMVVPNAPRFVRDNDQIIFSTKINNLTDQEIRGEVHIELFDPITDADLTDKLVKSSDVQVFNIPANQSQKALWTINIPKRKLNSLGYRIIAKSGNHSDGEENVIPVLTDKVLVTETMPLTVGPTQSKSFTFLEFLKASDSAVNHSYTFEYTANPAWYALQALPYIEENSHVQNTISIFNRLYTNILAAHIVNKHPKIKAVFDQWKMEDSDALLSNLEKNQELKSALLEETPWVRQALSESQQKKNIALLFDFNKMAHEKQTQLNLLISRQKASGGFAWKGAPRADRYVSHYVLEGLGHLKRLGINLSEIKEIQPMLNKLVQYVDEELRLEYLKSEKRKEDYLSRSSIQYLYARSFYNQIPHANNSKKAFKHFLNLASKKAIEQNVYLSGMLALSLNRFDKVDVAKEITASLLERAMVHPELGMYWNEGNGFHWYELPIERHAMMMELIVEMNESKYIDQLKLWLLRNKQTNHWKTTKATVAAIYALLIENEEDGISKWVIDFKIPKISFSQRQLDLSNNLEAGTAYVKHSWKHDEITKNLADIKIVNPNNHISWGAIYWQYFEDLNKVKNFKKTPLKLSKQLYKKVLDDRGEKMITIDSEKVLIGDQIVVRIELEVDRSMEYIHLKDMRASGLEPESTLSSYRWSHGLGYYQSTRDLATDFFISYLPKGKYVFEYTLRAQHAGEFSNGITTVQSMYAPEYSSHSEGVKLTIEEN